jgi:hypothetical protein
MTVPRGQVRVPEPTVWNIDETFDQALERNDGIVKDRRSSEQMQWKGI